MSADSAFATRCAAPGCEVPVLQPWLYCTDHEHPAFSPSVSPGIHPSSQPSGRGGDGHSAHTSTTQGETMRNTIAGLMLSVVGLALGPRRSR